MPPKSKLKDKILALRAEGKGYPTIAKILGCGKTTVERHCSEKARIRAREVSTYRRKNNLDHPLTKKLCVFKTRTYSSCLLKDTDFKQSIYYRIKFFRTDRKTKVMDKSTKFTVKELMAKIGDNPKCYITGESIDLRKTSTYHLDHIVPVSKGGTNTLDNANICLSEINTAKGSQTQEEFIQMCQKVLRYNGYDIIQKQNIEPPDYCI